MTMPVVMPRCQQVWNLPALLGRAKDTTDVRRVCVDAIYFFAVCSMTTFVTAAKLRFFSIACFLLLAVTLAYLGVLLPGATPHTHWRRYLSSVPVTCACALATAAVMWAVEMMRRRSFEQALRLEQASRSAARRRRRSTSC